MVDHRPKDCQCDWVDQKSIKRAIDGFPSTFPTVFFVFLCQKSAGKALYFILSFDDMISRKNYISQINIHSLKGLYTLASL
jgi:hypothetical protein